MAVRVLAPAKINLTLHVTGQRPDGYHLLDSLVIFGKAADVVQVRDAKILSLKVEGREAHDVPTGEDNLVLRAARLICKERGAEITLTKNLPVASGIGGGSADAAATLRALSALLNEPLPDRCQVLALGADVPVCLHKQPVRMQGVGERLSPTPEMPRNTGMLLVNPRVGLATPEVFRRLESRDNPPMPAEIPLFSDASELAEWLRCQRNDLESAAICLRPVIADVIRSIQKSGSLIARMSGSGATCFGLYASGEDAQLAQEKIRAAHPDWWTSWFDLAPMPSLS